MLFKLLCTLLVLAGGQHQRNTNPIYNNIKDNNWVNISINVQDTLKHDLCNDFITNITHENCVKTLFSSPNPVDFITIVDQTMTLVPTTNNLNCYKKQIYGSSCFSKTYQFVVSAHNISGSSFSTEKNFQVEVLPNFSKNELEALIIMVCGLGSVLVCGVSMCIQRSYQKFRIARRSRDT